MERFFVAIKEESLHAQEFVIEPLPAEMGATVLFLGSVRETGGKTSSGKRVTAISYDFHRSLAETALREIAREICDISPEVRIKIIHRVGYVKTGEVSIAIVVESPHRDDAYRFSRRIIEEIKRRVPIWKKEHYADGESDWLDGTSLRQVKGRN